MFHSLFHLAGATLTDEALKHFPRCLPCPNGTNGCILSLTVRLMS